MEDTVIMQTFIIGMGNTLLSDHGAGIYALNFLKNFHSDIPGTKYLNGEFLELDLATKIEPTNNLIVIDATNLNSQPGSVHTFVGNEMDSILNEQSKNASQEKGLVQLLKEIDLLDRLPERRALVGIQPLCLDEGECLSATVEDAIPNVCCRVLGLIEEWH